MKLLLCAIAVLVATNLLTISRMVEYRNLAEKYRWLNSPVATNGGVAYGANNFATNDEVKGYGMNDVFTNGGLQAIGANDFALTNQSIGVEIPGKTK